MLCGADDSDELSKEYAPYIDEETAHVERLKNARHESNRKDKRIRRLSNEVESLESEVDELSKVLKATKRKLERKEKEVGESGGNAADNTGDNKHRGNSDSNGKVSETKGQTYEATYYSAFCSTGCTGVTATGDDVSSSIYVRGKRVIAVDPNVIPLGSTVRVTTPNESFEATALDTGGDIKGNRIDILVESTEKAYSLGRHSVKVEVLN